jgi:macrolide transport system ATP-binding/permease protein
MLLHQLRSDVRYALKWLLRSPGFTAVAVLSLAIGIGFNAALFAVIDALLLRPFPVEEPQQLADVYTRGGDGDLYSTNSYPDFLDFRAQNQVFTDMLAYSPAIAAVKAGDQSRMALGEVVSGNYFQLLGVRPAIGRTLLPDDDRPGAQRVVVLSDHLWTRGYARDPQVLGKTMHIHGQPYTIVGVVARPFTGMVPMLQPEIWQPLAWVEEIEPAGIQEVVPSPTGNNRLERRGQRWLFIKGRLKPGETAERAQANLQAIMSQLAQVHGKTNEKRPIAVIAGVRVHPQADRAMRPVAVGLMVGVGLVLLVACANVANMLLARASSRQREIGIRLAIGASRGRLIRQLLTESVVLSLLGASAGVALAIGLLRVIEVMPIPIPIPIALTLQIDGRVLGFTIAIALAAGAVAGLAPALRATRPTLTADLKGEIATVQSGRRRWTLGDGLVAVQTAFTLTLLVAAGLLTRSIVEARRIDLGFKPAGLAAVSAELGLIGYTEQRAQALFERALDRIRALPGVQSASRAVRQPLSINFSRNSIFFLERQQAGDQPAPIANTSVDRHYFDTLGVRVLRGRNFSTVDTPASPRVAIVTDAFVRTYWNDGGDPIGRKFRLRGIDGPEYEVVGVVSDYKVETVGERPAPYIHYALSQRSFTSEVLLARTATDAGALVTAIKREILALEPNAIFLESNTMNGTVDATLLPARLAAQTAGLVGVVATALAAIGLYGVIAYAVARRTREIGIRIALGAAPAGVVGMVMRQGVAVAVTGIAIGVLLSWPAARAISAALYGVRASDPAAWLGAIGVLLTAAMIANYVPARRASRVEPTVALRTE